MLCDTLRTIIFTKEGKHKKMKTSVLLKRFIPYYGKYKGIMVMDLFCAALTTVCELVLPLILRGVPYCENSGYHRNVVFCTSHY